MVHLTNTPQAEYRAWFYPHEHVCDESASPSVKEGARQRLERMFDVISDQLGNRQWLLGDRFSAADLFLLMLIRWGRGMPRPPRTILNLGAFAQRVLARPAVQEAFRIEGIQAPLV
jgi:glutathione S-transferase